MRFSQVACAVALSAVVYAEANPEPANTGNTGTTGTTLSANAIQSGSFLDGSTEIGAAEVGQAKSLTSTNNFINNCAGKTLTNGLQITTGSCNGITMGDIPAKTNMVSSVITFPTTGGKAIASDTTFNITVQMANLVAGSFTNADATYYAAPQQLSGGLVVGHTHVTVQDLGNSLNPTQALDATKFAFFKGINDAGNGKGLLSAVVTGGLPAGNYRVCTLASASNHQPVLMPVAQRGTADDCTKFTVSGSGTTINAAANNGAGGIAAAAAAASAVAAGPAFVDTAAAVAATSSAAKGAKAAATSAAATSATKKGNKAAVATDAASSVASVASVATSATKKGNKAAAATDAASSAAATVASVATSAATKKGGKSAAATSAATATTQATAKSTGNAGNSKAGSGAAAAANGKSGGTGGRRARARRSFIA